MTVTREQIYAGSNLPPASVGPAAQRAQHGGRPDTWPLRCPWSPCVGVDREEARWRSRIGRQSSNGGSSSGAGNSSSTSSSQGGARTLVAHLEALMWRSTQARPTQAMPPLPTTWLISDRHCWATSAPSLCKQLNRDSGCPAAEAAARCLGGASRGARRGRRASAGCRWQRRATIWMATQLSRA